jgi:NAD(P)-dependent dehydrogenase (short-subunit alcohol dehydrogenase family)
VEAERGNPYDAAYAATKAATNNLTRSVAREWAPFGINVNAIGPGAFLTDMTRHLERAQPLTESQMEGRIKSAIERIPLKRWGDLRELGLLAVFLASDASNYITGQTIYLDGGLLA